jgi:hypothetical protein
VSTGFASLGTFERPLAAGRIGQGLGEVSLGPGRVLEEAAGAGDELLKPRRGEAVELPERALENL